MFVIVRIKLLNIFIANFTVLLIFLFQILPNFKTIFITNVVTSWVIDLNSIQKKMNKYI